MIHPLAERHLPLPAARRGAVLVMMLVCLLVVGSLGVLMLRSALHEVGQSRTREQQLQTLWLVESGLERGLVRLAASSDYSGETWHIAADELNGQDAASVRIAIERIEDIPLARRVTVEAIYPDEPLHRIVQRRTIQIELLSPGGDP
jgi:Tfp pilus assembly protein PilX